MFWSCGRREHGKTGCQFEIFKADHLKRERSQKTEHTPVDLLFEPETHKTSTFCSTYMSTLAEKTWALSAGFWRPGAGGSSHQKSGGKFLILSDWRDHTPTVPSYEVETRKAWSHDIRILKPWSQRENIQRADDGFWIYPTEESRSCKLHAVKLRQKNMTCRISRLWRFWEKRERRSRESRLVFDVVQPQKTLAVSHIIWSWGRESIIWRNLRFWRPGENKRENMKTTKRMFWCDPNRENISWGCVGLKSGQKTHVSPS